MAAPKAVSANEKKMNKLKRNVFVAVVLAIIAVSVSLVVLKFLFDIWTYNIRVQSAQREAQTALEHNLEQFEEIRNWYGLLEGARGNVANPGPDEVLDALPGHYDFPALAASVNKLSERSGVQLQEFNGVDEEGSVPGFSHQPEPYEINFSVEVSGSYQDIQVFINTLDLSIRPFQVRQIKLLGSDDALLAEIHLATYFQPMQNLNYPERTVR